MDMRTYAAADKEGCLAVFDTNLPTAFHPSEREEFARFLDAPAGPYYVLDHEGAIVGCGGYAMEQPDLASLCWILVRQDLHGNGLGKLLVFTVLRKLGIEADPAMVRLHTPPKMAGFFERQGFRVVETLPDGIAPGMDRVEMRKKLKVCP
jgi:N-acetylglutamate synthase-like GNAT family acetyltransferase